MLARAAGSLCPWLGPEETAPCTRALLQRPPTPRGPEPFPAGTESRQPWSLENLASNRVRRREIPQAGTLQAPGPVGSARRGRPGDPSRDRLARSLSTPRPF